MKVQVHLEKGTDGRKKNGFHLQMWGKSVTQEMTLLRFFLLIVQLYFFLTQLNKRLKC